MGAGLPQEPHVEDCDAAPVFGNDFAGFNKWSYALKFDLPSRMATAKNAMGNSVSIITAYAPPDVAAGEVTLPATWDGPIFPPSSPPTASDVTFPRVVITTRSDAGGTPDTWIYTLEAGPDAYLTDPGLPFAACVDSGCTAGQPALPGHFTVTPPQDAVGRSRFDVNWGLITYQSDDSSTLPEAEAIQCGHSRVQQLVDIRDHIQPADDHDVSQLQSYLQLGATSPGLIPSGYTPTKAGLDLAVASHRDVFAVDPLYKCNRSYGTVLITDGLSNMCNPNNGDWFNTCGGDGNPNVPDPTDPARYYYPNAICFAECLNNADDSPAPARLPCTGYRVNPYLGKCCDGVIGITGGYNCFDPDPPGSPNNDYTNFPAGAAEDAWNLNLQQGSPLLPDPALQVRTFVIGISDIVGPCELNRIAYRGRTDAALPEFGLLTPSAYLPDATFEYNTVNHANYATFATNAASIADALLRIANSGAAGDYTTSAPVSGSAIQGQEQTIYLASVDYPAWKGHFYALDGSGATNPGDVGYELWDAGRALLTTVQADATTRKIYTWDPATCATGSPRPPCSLVRIDSSAGPTLDAISGEPSGTFDAALIDFIQGNDGSGMARTWVLGGIINATPAIVTRPLRYSNLSVENHAGFEAAYAQRKDVIWIGADDGMLHCFSADDGTEITALIPPNLLSLQKLYFQNYQALPNDFPTGQFRNFDSHAYGVANSLRYLDIYFPNATPDPTYKTVGILTEGPAGRLVAAIDITHPSPTDPSYGVFDGTTTNEPVQVLWTLDGATASGDMANLFETWSVPSIAPVTRDKWRMILGAGFNAASTAATPVAPKAFVLDPVDGSFQVPAAPLDLDVDTTNTPFVGNQSFAHTTFIDTEAPSFLSDDKADLGLVPDLNGRIWFVSASAPAAYDNFAVGIDASKFVGQSQPLYYTTASSGYGPRGTGCDLFTFGSGTFYEESPTVTGDDVGDAAGVFFTPSLYLAVKPKGVSPIDSSPGDPHLYRLKIRDIPRPAGDPAGGGHLGQHTQIVSAPFIVVPRSGIGISSALFLLFDPDNGCDGRTYVARLNFTATSCEVQFNDFTDATDPSTVYDGGEGAGGGFVIGDRGVLSISKSGPTHAYVDQVDNFPPEGPPAHLSPTWWRELK